ncbi:3-deoxy-D-manno-octulosonic acid transferase [Aurantibacter sp.]|uniref:3-deoxy-D-manno-octulosonic acid transferase n=1 Tax=Aurantibacter sp. TaxID=2807103 RepID=UPI0035C80868
MMRFIYNIFLFKASIIIRFLSLFNSKIKKGVIGRSETFNKIHQNLNSSDKTIWFHCASLGEYEQGLPVFEAIRLHYPKHKIILSFFSPSGYEIRKNTKIADVVVYLSLDTSKNAKQFINILKPELSIFVKYDIWPNYLNELNKLNLKAVLISAAFRPNQIYFKWYGGLFTKALKSFDYIFTQNNISKKLLSSINYNNVTVSGDTRFDRVNNQLKTDNTLSFIEEFKDNKTTIVFGSSWEEDENVFIDFINNSNTSTKFIIAPHEIKDETIKRLQNNIKKDIVLFSNKEHKNLTNHKVFIIDTIGLLSKIYRYADIAYVGGAIGKTGLHNILEPATFGVPVLFGNNHKKFPEAKALIDFGGGFEISSKKSFNTVITSLTEDKILFTNSSKASKAFIASQLGAKQAITEYLFK